MAILVTDKGYFEMEGNKPGKPIEIATAYIGYDLIFLAPDMPISAATILTLWKSHGLDRTAVRIVAHADEKHSFAKEFVPRGEEIGFIKGIHVSA